MKAIQKVLPSSPQFTETIIAKNQPEYLQLPIAIVNYDNCTGFISRYKLNLKERIKLLFSGNLWIEQLTGGQLQPQRPTVYEPLTKADENYSKQKEQELKLQSA
jgi:hypothetical protein